MKRQIIEIDEELCDGCEECIPGCPEGAIQIIDGKARLVLVLALVLRARSPLLNVKQSLMMKSSLWKILCDRVRIQSKPI
jgi:ferredoxin